MRRLWAVLAFLAFSSCSVAEDVEWAVKIVRNPINALGGTRAALELLGILPNYECGEAQRQFVLRAVGEVSARIGCATVSTEPKGDEDLLLITFPAEGCAIGQGKATGRIVFTISGGDSRLEIEADFSEAKVNGDPVTGALGYRKCGDAATYTAFAQGTLEGMPWMGDVAVTIKSGGMFGNTTYEVDGLMAFLTEAGADRVSLRGLTYVSGDFLPSDGTLTIAASTGDELRADFDGGDQISLKINERDPVKVPLF